MNNKPYVLHADLADFFAIPGGARVLTGTAITNGTWTQLTGRFDGTAGGAPMELWVDGASVDTDTSAGGLASSSTTLTVGSQLPSGGRLLDGAIAEIIIYDAALSGTDRATVEAYLSSKWGL